MKYKTIDKVITVFIICAIGLLVCPAAALLFVLSYNTNLIPFYIVLGINSAVFVPSVIYLGRLIFLYRKALKTAPKLKGVVCGRTYRVWGSRYWCRLEIALEENKYLTPEVYNHSLANSMSEQREQVEFIVVKNRAYITDVITLIK